MEKRVSEDHNMERLAWEDWREVRLYDVAGALEKVLLAE